MKTKMLKYYPGNIKVIFNTFNFVENRYYPNGYLSGYSNYNADYVETFKSRNNQIVAHEFLNSINLLHFIKNKETSSNALYTYKYKKTDNLLDYSHNDSNSENKRYSLFYWQWKQANSSIK